MEIVLSLLIGCVSGVFGGMFGLGGGIVIVPACVFFLKMGQKQAQGTSLVALLLPVGALAAWNYWKSGELDKASVLTGLWIAGGFLFGGIFGSKLALSLNEVVLRRLFAGFLVLIAAQLFFKKS